MDKLASQQYDILDYLVTEDFKKVATVISTLSKEAQTAEIPEFDDMQKRAESDFALIVSGIKKFAKYDKTSTELSLAFLNDSLSQIPDELAKTAATNLTVAGDMYGVEVPNEIRSLAEGERFIDPNISVNEINKLAYAHKINDAAEIEKTAYALPGKNKYPLKSAADVTQAKAYFEQNYDRMDGIEAIEFAANVKTACVIQGVESSKVIEKWASLDTDVLNPDYNFLIKSRFNYLAADDTETREKYEGLLGKTAEKIDVRKTYDSLIELDKTAGLYNHWSDGIANPALTVFMQKTASAAVTNEDLKAIPYQELEAVVGEEAAKELQSDEGYIIYTTLPHPLRNAVNSLIIK